MKVKLAIYGVTGNIGYTKTTIFYQLHLCHGKKKDQLKVFKGPVSGFII